MPHSSGGGSSGGGFHGGSSGSSVNTTRYSSRPFAGASCYVYYGAFSHAPRVVYTNGSPKASMRNAIVSVVVLFVFAIAPWGFLIWSGYHNPVKLATNYDTTLHIDDTRNLLTPAQEESLKGKFTEFFTVSGITPALVTVDDADWTTFATLEDYAYRKYVSLFSDERHWLIVFSTFGSNTSRWAYEGMQGNETDPILYTQKTDRFNAVMRETLGNDRNNLYNAVDASFSAILPGLMELSFSLDWKLLAFGIVWSSITLVAAGMSVVGLFRQKGLKNAVQVPDGTNLVMEKCPHCHAPYYVGTTDRCPKCGEAFGPAHIAHPPQDK